MRLTVVGGQGAYPTGGVPCSGYLVEHDGWTLLIDPGYGVALSVDAAAVDAVFVSHSHPDHCADLNPLVRARVLGPAAAPPLPVACLRGAVDAVLALDGPRLGVDAVALVDVAPDATFAMGPFTCTTAVLPHHVPDAGIRVEAGGSVLVYTGDSGPSAEIARLADGADVLVADATYAEVVPEPNTPYLGTATQAGADATAAGVGRLVLAHLWPGSDAAVSVAAARARFDGAVVAARPGVTIDLEA